MDLQLPTFGLGLLDFPEGHITSLRLSSLSIKGRSLISNWGYEHGAHNPMTKELISKEMLHRFTFFFSYYLPLFQAQSPFSGSHIFIELQFLLCTMHKP